LQTLAKQEIFERIRELDPVMGETIISYIQPINVEILRRGLETRWLGRPLRIVDECSSTNDVVDQLAKAGVPHGLVVIAETQTAGRGRFGRIWISPRGGVWLSILLRPQSEGIRFDYLPLIGAISIAKPLAEYWGLRAKVRWPNDVVVGGRKLAGVLVESKSAGNELAYVNIGMGINANFDPSQISALSGSPTTLIRHLGRAVNREQLIQAILLEMERMCDALDAGHELDIQHVLEELDCSRGSFVRVKSSEGELEGLFECYETLGRVKIRTSGGHVSVENYTVVSVDYQSD